MTSERPLLDRDTVYRPAVPSVLDAVHLELRRFWSDMDAVFVVSVAERWRLEFETGFSEICANVIKHAFAGSSEPGTMTLRLRLFTNRVEAELMDDGSLFHEKSKAGGPGQTDLPESGRGLQVARSLLDNLEYRRDRGSKNYWLLVKYLS